MNLSDSDEDSKTLPVPLWKDSLKWTIENWSHFEGPVHQEFTFHDKEIVDICFTRNDSSLFVFIFQALSAHFPSKLWIRISFFTVDRSNTMYIQEKLKFANGCRQNSLSFPLQQDLIHPFYLKNDSLHVHFAFRAFPPKPDKPQPPVLPQSFDPPKAKPAKLQPPALPRAVDSPKSTAAKLQPPVPPHYFDPPKFTAAKLQPPIPPRTFNSPKSKTITRSLWNGPRSQVIGLRNQGATCYLNSFLQSLYHIPGFRRIIYQIPTTEPFQDIPSNLQTLFGRLQAARQTVDTIGLTQSLGMTEEQIERQPDIQEFYRSLFAKLKDQLGDTKEQNAITAFFNGQYQVIVRCPKVDFQTTKTEEFYDLSLFVKNCANLTESFEKYIEGESLTSDNCYIVPGYGAQEAFIATEFLKFPPVLHIHLRRFEYDVRAQMMTKINSYFEYPKEIDLGRFLAVQNRQTGTTVYELFGVLVHSGTPFIGHCSAYLRPAKVRAWLKFDDVAVTPVDEESVFQKMTGGKESFGFTAPLTAYLLVYIQQSEIERLFEDVDNGVIPRHVFQM
jgi:ubiquitin C-terminal hydrolase